MSAETLYPCPPAEVDAAPNVLLPGHDVPLGRYSVVRRLLPQRERRLVGAWCFADQFGPDRSGDRPGMQIAPHPHTGLQTVTWLLAGEIVHRDSLGHRQSITPGQLNLMTSGHGIAHSERAPAAPPAVMHGLQLWIALPEPARHGPPAFDHHPALPVVELGEGATATVVVGELAGATSPARVHTPLVGAELAGPGGSAAVVPLRPDFEYAVLALAGAAEVAGVPLAPGGLLYLGRSRRELTVRTTAPARLFLLGGEPFEEPLVMWWNFVGRGHEEIVQARADWEAGTRFGVVAGDPEPPLPAPELPAVRLKARDRHGTRLD